MTAPTQVDWVAYNKLNPRKYCVVTSELQRDAQAKASRVLRVAAADVATAVVCEGEKAKDAVDRVVGAAVKGTVKS